jgi:hypothetical protein
VGLRATVIRARPYSHTLPLKLAGERAHTRTFARPLSLARSLTHTHTYTHTPTYARARVRVRVRVCACAVYIWRRQSLKLVFLTAQKWREWGYNLIGGETLWNDWSNTWAI